MLHVTNYSGNVVMVLCISLYVKPLQPCRFLGFEQLIFSRWQEVMSSVGHMGAGFIPLHAHTCMCLSPLLSHVLFFLNLPLSVPKLEPYSAFACLKKQTPPPPCSTLSSTLQLLLMCYVCATEVKSKCYEGGLGACRYFLGTQPVDS